MPAGHKVHSVAPVSVSQATQGHVKTSAEYMKERRQRAHPRARSCRRGTWSTKSQARRRFELIYIPAGKLKGSLESLLIFKTMYSFYLNAHKTTMSCIKHFMRVEFCES